MHVLGAVTVWAATILFAYWVGRSANRISSQTGAALWVSIILALLIGGASLWASTSSDGEAMWIEDPEAADRWQDDLRQEERWHAE
jgi:hypothetical protein